MGNGPDYGGGGQPNWPGGGGGGGGGGCTQVCAPAMVTVGSQITDSHQQVPEWWEGPSDPEAYDTDVPGVPRTTPPPNFPPYAKIDCRMVCCPPPIEYLRSADIKAASRLMQEPTQQDQKERCAWLYRRAYGSIRVGVIMLGNGSVCAGIWVMGPGGVPDRAIGSLHSHLSDSRYLSADDAGNVRWDHTNMAVAHPQSICVVDMLGIVSWHFPRQD